ncbi:peroxisomal membrane protein PMP34 [Exaiptasia diaphana]|uniref:Peroxisomal membrane protein PMP34 n=1 Tax=Exaiptasia diaphana TaxID=2652724 RepID=A0A913Y8C9_EXADI|nr:peroxisomal membrane protein PMP34 [Exaiptasia diaphana]KXJ21682.1 Peroxisomal membrane protein PMP34 [Exaiptasia diaphana]
MTIFSKTVSFNDLVPLLPYLEIPQSLRAVFSFTNFVHALSGAIGSVTAMTTFYPLDTARTRLQVDDNRKSKGTFNVLKEIMQDEGIKSWYRGLGPVLFSLYCSNFLYFYTFNSLKAVFLKNRHSSSKRQDLLFGYISGLVNVLLTTPLWVANTRLKLQGVKFRSQNLESENCKHKYSGIIDVITQIVQEEGALSLWNGIGSSVFLAGNPAIQFMVYESIKRFLRRTGKMKLSATEFFLIGAIAKAVATVLTYPLQIAQCKQRAGYQETKQHTHLLSLLSKLMRERGFLGLYKGMEAKLLQTVMTAALMFLAYEKISAFIFAMSRRMVKR